MSYSKKDEDGDSAILKVDRTSVYQEGISTPLPLFIPACSSNQPLQPVYSTLHRFLHGNAVSFSQR